jgi:excisionase family DNA binding protein
MEKTEHAPRMLLRVEELADELRVSRAQAYRLIARGDIPSFAIGRSRRVLRTDLERWVRSAADAVAGEA